MQQLHQELSSKLGQQAPTQQADLGELSCPAHYVANWTPRSSMDSHVSANPDGRFSMDGRFSLDGPGLPRQHESGVPQPQKPHRYAAVLPASCHDCAS